MVETSQWWWNHNTDGGNITLVVDTSFKWWRHHTGGGDITQVDRLENV